MEKILLYIKHNIKLLWKLIECGNELILRVVYKKQIAALEERCRTYIRTNSQFQYRLITSADLGILHGFLSVKDKEYVKYFKPHSFTYESLKAVLASKNYLTFGYFQHDQMIGYFMMRLFANKKIFFGYIVDAAFTGKNIGKDMVSIMFEIAKSIGWESYATIAKENIASRKLHKCEIVKQLPNDYMLVRFVD